MPFIHPINPANATAEVASTLSAVKGKLGMVPNLFATLAHAPTVLKGYLGLADTLGGGRLTSAQREIIALAVGQANACQYCLSAHTLLGQGAGLNSNDIAQARNGNAATRLDAALAGLSRKLTEQRGKLDSSDLEAYRHAGVDDGLMLEVVAAVALNTLTNYANHVAGTEVDFPAVKV